MTSFHSKSLPYLHVKGSNYQIGYQIGVHFKTQIDFVLQNRAKFIRQKTADSKDPSRINTMLTIVKQYFPQFVEEIQGIAEGANLPFRDLFIHNCMHIPETANCSTGIFQFPNKTFLVHNEDFDPIMKEQIYFVFVELSPGTGFFSHCYPGVLPGMSNGFNSDGLVITCNYLPDPHQEIGLSRVFFGRAMLEQKKMTDAIDILHTYVPRTGGVSYSICSKKEHKSINIETTGRDLAMTNITDRFFRANHYISDVFTSYPAHTQNTLNRQTAGNKLIKQGEKTLSNLLEIMWNDEIFVDLEDTNHEYQTNGTVAITINDDITFQYYRRTDRRKLPQEIRLSELVD